MTASATNVTSIGGINVLGSFAAAGFTNALDGTVTICFFADVSKALNYIGVTISRLTYQENSLMVSKASIGSTRSRIEDVHMAEEQLVDAKLQILQQTAAIT